MSEPPLNTSPNPVAPPPVVRLQPSSLSSAACDVVLLRVRPDGLYAFFCQELRLKPNSAVLRRLSSVCLLCQTHASDSSCDEPPVVSTVTNEAAAAKATTMDHDPLRLCEEPCRDENNGGAHDDAACDNGELDLSRNFIGSDGLRALLQTIRVVHFFSKLNLSGAHLDTKAVADLTRYLDGVESITELDLSDNVGITQQGGRYLKLFAGTNCNVCRIHLQKTSVTLALVKVIERVLQSNATLRGNHTAWQEKLMMQRRARGAAGGFQGRGSLQPTPMKRTVTDSVPTNATQTGALTTVASSRDGSLLATAVLRGDSLLAIGSNDANAEVASFNGTGNLLLPPFQNSCAIAGVGNRGVVSVSPRNGGQHVVPTRPSGAEPLDDLVETLSEDPLLPIEYVFAAALPPVSGVTPVGGHHYHRSVSTTAADSSSRPPVVVEFAALRLLQEVMMEPVLEDMGLNGGRGGGAPMEEGEGNDASLGHRGSSKDS